MNVLTNGSTGIITLSKLFDHVSREFQDEATVTASLYDADGNEILSSLSLTQVGTGRNSVYRGEVSHTVSLPAGTQGTIRATATSGGKVRQWVEPILYRGRPSVPGEGIPYDSPDFFPYTLDTFDMGDYADTAAWVAAWTAKYDANTSSGVIDSEIQFNGRNTLRLAEKAGSASMWGYLYPETVPNKVRQKYWVRLSDTFEINDASTLVVHLAKLFNDSNTFDFGAEIDYQVDNQSFKDEGSGLIDTQRVWSLADLRGRWIPFFTELDNSDPANAIVRHLVGSTLIMEKTVDTGSATVGVEAIAWDFGLTGGVANPNNYINIAQPEAVDIEAYPNAHTGLGTVVDEGAPLVEPTQVFPSEILIPQAETHQFSLRIDGVDTPADSWEATGGTIDAGGLFTAGNADGEYTITATKDATEYTSTVEISDFDPQADVASLRSWVEVENSPGVDGEIIDELVDSSGNDCGYTEFQTGRNPVFKANQCNGYAAVESDGIDDMMTSKNPPVPEGGARSSYAVVRAIGGERAAVFALFSGNSKLVRPDLNTQWQWFTFTGVPLGVLARDDRWYLFRYRLNSAESQEAAINGEAFVEGAPIPWAWSGEGGRLNRILAHSTNDVSLSQFEGSADFAITVSDAEDRQIRRWLNARYRIY